MSESHEALRERAISAGVAYIEANRAVHEAYALAMKAVQELPETAAMAEATKAFEVASKETSDVSVEANVLPIAEQMELVDIIADRTGSPRPSFEDKFATLTSEEKQRYNDELAALGEAAQAA